MRSRSITGDRLKVVTINVLEILKLLCSADGNFVKLVFVLDEQHSTFLKHPASDIQRQLLEEFNIQVKYSKRFWASFSTSQRLGHRTRQTSMSERSCNSSLTALPNKMTAKTSLSCFACSRSAFNSFFAFGNHSKASILLTPLVLSFLKRNFSLQIRAQCFTPPSLATIANTKVPRGRKQKTKLQL